MNVRLGRALLCATAATAALGVGACGSGDEGGGGGGGGGGGEPIKVGIQTSKTGALAALGQDQEFGIKAAIAQATNGTNEVAGRKIEYVVGDDQSDPGQAPRVARQMLQQDKPDVVFGFPSSASALAAAPVQADAEVIDIYTIAAADELTAFSPTTFRTSRNATQEAKMGSEAVGIKQGQTFMIVAPDYAYGQSAAKAWEALLKEQGGEQLGSTVFAPLDARDFTSAVERVRSEKPEILVVVTFAGTGGPRLFQAIGRANITDDTRVVTLLPQRPTREALGSIATKVEYFAIYDPKLATGDLNAGFLEQFKKESGGKEADIYAGDPGVGGELLVQALEKTKGDTDSQVLRKAMEGLTGTGIKGDYTVRAEDHTFLFSFYSATLNDQLEAQLKKEFTQEASEVPVSKTIEER
jgi:branched-chain amino acid transport system substrate-binding protein